MNILPFEISDNGLLEQPTPLLFTLRTSVEADDSVWLHTFLRFFEGSMNSKYYSVKHKVCNFKQYRFISRV